MSKFILPNFNRVGLVNCLGRLLPIVTVSPPLPPYQPLCLYHPKHKRITPCFCITPCVRITPTFTVWPL